MLNFRFTPFPCDVDLEVSADELEATVDVEAYGVKVEACGVEVDACGVEAVSTTKSSRSVSAETL